MITVINKSFDHHDVKFYAGTNDNENDNDDKTQNNYS